MARADWPEWEMQRVLARLHVSFGHLNVEQLADELGLTDREVVDLAADSARFTGYRPILYCPHWTH